MRYLLLFGFLDLINAQDPAERQSYPDNFIPDNLSPINKLIDVTFTHNLPNNFDLREEADYSWSYFDSGRAHTVCRQFPHTLNTLEPKKNLSTMVWIIVRM